MGFRARVGRQEQCPGVSKSEIYIRLSECPRWILLIILLIVQIYFIGE
jgi:hypothetical protein